MKSSQWMYVLLAAGLVIWLIARRGGDDEQLVRKKLEEFRTLIEKQEEESALAAAQKGQALGEMLAEPFSIELQPVNQRVTDRQALLGPFVGYRQGFDQLNVSFSGEDLQIEAGTSRATLSLRAAVTGFGPNGTTRDSFDVTFRWSKATGDWLIEQATVTGDDSSLF